MLYCMQLSFVRVCMYSPIMYSAYEKKQQQQFVTKFLHLCPDFVTNWYGYSVQMQSQFL